MDKQVGSVRDGAGDLIKVYRAANANRVVVYTLESGRTARHNEEQRAAVSLSSVEVRGLIELLQIALIGIED